jgi:2-polyprenyl-3-methyl-5-hydroxy-6-metoxy-1,4-benzoquinol methylase
MITDLFSNKYCPMCKSPFENNLVGRVRECEYETTDQFFEMHQCKLCETVTLNPRPTEKDLNAIYPDNYYSYNMDMNKQDSKTGNKSFVQGIFFNIMKRNMKKQILTHVSAPIDRPIRILDIGCGVGSQLDNFKIFYPSAETWGVDFGEQAILRARQRGHKAMRGRFEDIEFPENYFDIIISIHVIEHVSEPDIFVEKALRLLNKDGVLTLATPNTDCWDYKFLKKKHWGGYHTPRHWYIFNIHSFKALANRLGFKLVNWAPYTLSSFWVVSCHSVVRSLLGKKIAGIIFPPVKIMKGGLYSFLLLSFFAVFERTILFLTGKANSMWVTIKRG